MSRAQPGASAAGAAAAAVNERASAADPIIELCAFRVGDEEYAIDLRRIREILQPLPITPVPHASERVEGVMSLRGEVIPVVDVRKCLGAAVRPGARAKVLVVNVAGRVLALVVDAVAEVVRIPRSAIGPPPPLLRGTGPRLFLGACRACDARTAAARPGAPRLHGRADGPRLRLLLNVKALLHPDARRLGRAADAARLGEPRDGVRRP